MDSTKNKELNEWIDWKNEINDPDIDQHLDTLINTFSEYQLNLLLKFFRSREFYITMKLSGELGDFLTALARTMK